MNRREFVARGLKAAAGAGLALGAVGNAAWAAGPKRIRRGGMVYRRLGRTELMVSEIGLGGSPSPPPPIFTACLERGINFVDTSASYQGGEAGIAEVTKGRRDKIIISTRFHPRFQEPDLKGQVTRAVEASLQRLQTDHLDLMGVHGVGDPKMALNDDILAGLAQAKQEGKIRFTSLSNHQNPVGVLTPIIESGHYDAILMGLSAFSGATVKPEDVKAGKVYDNWLQDSGLQSVLDLALAKGVGIIAIKTMSGGARQNLGKYQTGPTTLPQAKLKWALSCEGVCVAITELNNFDMMNEDLAVIGTTLSAEDQGMLREHIRERSAEVCRMCGTCLHACPAGVPIPDILRYVMYHDEHGKAQQARREFNGHVSGLLLAACTGCDSCARACPHGLNIPGQLRYAREVLG